MDYYWHTFAMKQQLNTRTNKQTNQQKSKTFIIADYKLCTPTSPPHVFCTRQMRSNLDSCYWKDQAWSFAGKTEIETGSFIWYGTRKLFFNQWRCFGTSSQPFQNVHGCFCNRLFTWIILTGFQPCHFLQLFSSLLLYICLLGMLQKTEWMKPSMWSNLWVIPWKSDWPFHDGLFAR